MTKQPSSGVRHVLYNPWYLAGSVSQELVCASLGWIWVGSWPLRVRNSRSYYIYYDTRSGSRLGIKGIIRNKFNESLQLMGGFGGGWYDMTDIAECEGMADQTSGWYICFRQHHMIVMGIDHGDGPVLYCLVFYSIDTWGYSLLSHPPQGRRAEGGLVIDCLLAVKYRW